MSLGEDLYADALDALGDDAKGTVRTEDGNTYEVMVVSYPRARRSSEYGLSDPTAGVYRMPESAVPSAVMANGKVITFVRATEEIKARIFSHQPTTGMVQFVTEAVN